jgi:MFS family permease
MQRILPILPWYVFVGTFSIAMLIANVTAAQGLLLGAGMSFVDIPASGMCPRYFKRNRALASGVSVAGSSLGGVIWPIACDQLLHNAGLSFGWTIRIVGFTMIPLLFIVVLTVRPPAAVGSRVDENSDGTPGLSDKTPIDRRELRKDIAKPPFVLLCIGLFLAYLGFFGPFFFISTYATHLGMSQRMAFYIVSILNAASLFGRILPGFWVSLSTDFYTKVTQMRSNMSRLIVTANSTSWSSLVCLQE